MTGNISVQTDNIFPIIKRFLYSDQEIFLRELVSNAVDATTKLQILARRGELVGDVGNVNIEIIVEPTAKTITIRDRGIGMTQDEVEKYLNQVAFSGASEFLNKFEGEAGIIGFFGLGFYSAFMVAAKVEVITKSYHNDATAVRWSCEGTPQYQLDIVEKSERGTDVILHISEEAAEYLDKNKIGDLLEKYCKFLPSPILYNDIQVNDTRPLWTRKPNEITEEEYTGFYNKLFPHTTAPLFWIHLNIDYPFNLTGILYFPKITNSLEPPKNQIQLYCNQVFVTDDVRNIVPEFLTMLHGVIDSPNIPLNVSRSSLQADREVKKITNYITKKVADKLHELFNADRISFNQKWHQIGLFVKYGMLADDKFEERARDFALIKNIDGDYFTFEEYKERVKEQQTDKNGKVIFLYTNDIARQSSYVEAAKRRGYDVVDADSFIDNHYHQLLEGSRSERGATFVRVDSSAMDEIIEKDEPARESVLSEVEQNQILDVFKGIFKEKDAEKGEATNVELRPLSPEDSPVQITRTEFIRRMQEMQQLAGGSMFGNIPDTYSVIINSNHPIVAKTMLSTDDKDELAKYLYDTALLNQGMLKGAELTDFVNRTLKYVAK